MSVPRVSICLPNRNTRAYLEERIETILAQTYTNWELVVSDNHSDDGAWELLESVARTDHRVSLAQAPREGLYANWNRCLERARGELIYIATSDDTMATDCLERLVAALDIHPECDIAHCPLRTIDETGQNLPEWWSQGSVFALSSGPLLDVAHVRKAPFDGLLHLLGGSVYVSITQLLIRRSLFDRIGFFESTWQSLGDFNWNMRAGLVANTVHVPDTWGGWRIHRSQATAGAGIGSADHARRIDEMIEHAIDTCNGLLSPVVSEQLTRHWQHEAKAFRCYMRDIADHRTSFGQKAYILRRALAGSAPAWQHLKLRLRGRTLLDWVRTRLDDAGVGPMLVPALGPSSWPAGSQREPVRTLSGNV